MEQHLKRVKMDHNSSLRDSTLQRLIKFCFSGKFGSEESEIKHLSHPLLYDINIFKTRQASFLKMSIFTLGKPREISTLLLARQASRARSVDIV